MQFESIGGSGHGCEFGTFQRACGAGPLSLLCWADFEVCQFSTVLETEFLDVGEVEFTPTLVPPHQEAEYWTGNIRHQMNMRSFIKVEDVPEARMERIIAQRPLFFFAKLIEALEAGEEVFVFTSAKEPLSDEELARLHTGCKINREPFLLYVCIAPPGRRSGSIEVVATSLIIGYVEHFSQSPIDDGHLGNSHANLIDMCGATLAFAWRSLPEDSMGARTRRSTSISRI